MKHLQMMTPMHHRHSTSSPSVAEVMLHMRSTEDVERAIRATCAAGILAGVGYAVGALWEVVGSGLKAMPASAPGDLLVATLLFGAVYGVLRYSRVASVALLAVFVGTQLHTLTGDVGGVTGVVASAVSLIFIFIFVRGVQATFTYYRLIRRFDSWQQTMDSALDPRLFEDD